MGTTLKELANRLAHSAGLTKSTRRELSDIITEETEVVKRSVEETYFPSYYSPYSRFGEAAPHMEYYNYFVKLAGSREFEVNDELLYRTTQVGDRVRLSYRNISDVVSDYANGDFSRKVELERALAGIKVEKFEKL